MASFDEMLEYIVKHDLYLEGLERCKYLPETSKTIQIAHARYLLRNLLYKEAAIGMILERGLD
jgi:hypothetical protein